MHFEKTAKAPSTEAPPTIDAHVEGDSPPERQAAVDEGARMAGWPLDRLGQRAELENERITGEEIEVTPYYWKLGVIMRLAKPCVDRGHWQHWLLAHGIAKVRAFRARTLAAAFPSREDLEGLTLGEAMMMAIKARQQKPNDVKRRARNRLKAMSAALVTIEDDLKDAGDSASLIPLIDALAQRVASLRQAVGGPGK